MNLILAISMLCQINGSHDSLAITIEAIQKNCHVYYAVCLKDKSLATEKDVLDCMAKRPRVAGE